MSSRGQTDLDVPSHCLVSVTGRDDCRPDHSTQRNALTSIYWVPTVKSPTLPLVANLSDHVHYYQGGQAFQYHIYNPVTSTLRSVILGPNLPAGHQLQVPVLSGEWKCGCLIAADDASCPTDRNVGIAADYSIIAEAVGPGFDVHDFSWVREKQLADSHPSEAVAVLLQQFLHQPADAAVTKEEEFDSHYNEDSNQERRTQARA